MSLWSRVRARFGRPAAAAAPPDPRDGLDRAYGERLALLQQARRGLADVATARARLQQQAAESEHQAVLLRTQAEQSVAADRDDVALELLTRAAELTADHADRDRQLAELRAQEDGLSVAVATLAGQVERLRTTRETLSAQYTAADTQATLNGALAGLTGELTDPDTAVRAVEDETLRRRATAAAFEELTPPGPDAPLGTSAALPPSAVSARAELARLKARHESSPGDPLP